MIHSRFALLAIFAGIPVLIAAEPAAVATVRCRVFAIGKAPEGEVFVKSGGKYTPIRISTDYITPSFRTDAKQGIVFFRKHAVADPKDKEAKDSYEPFASCHPDGNATRQLVFILPGATASTWEARAKSDSDSAFPPGTRLVINLSDVPLGIDFGGTQLSVKPKGSGLLGAAKSAPDGMAPVKISRRAATGEWVTFSSNIWRQCGENRKILMVYPVPGSESLAISSIQDTVEAPDAVEKTAKEKVAQVKHR